MKIVSKSKEIRRNKLENRNTHITSQFVRIFKVFEDFRFIQQLREEMDKVRPAVAMIPSQY